MRSSILRSLSVLIIALSALLGGRLATAQEGELEQVQPKGITPEEIIQRFAAKEKEFKTAWEQYSYREDVKLETLDGDTVDGEFKEVFDISFDDRGRRVRNMVFAPQPNLTRIIMTRE